MAGQDFGAATTAAGSASGAASHDRRVPLSKLPPIPCDTSRRTYPDNDLRQSGDHHAHPLSPRRSAWVVSHEFKVAILDRKSISCTWRSAVSQNTMSHMSHNCPNSEARSICPPLAHPMRLSECRMTFNPSEACASIGSPMPPMPHARSDNRCTAVLSIEPRAGHPPAGVVA